MAAAQTRSVNEVIPYIAWIVALTATAGSLFFSEVMELPPCLLCWYQRIAMYPLVAIIAMGIAMRETAWKLFAAPLAVAGLIIAIYHNLLYYGIIPESITPCKEGISCTTVQLEWLGFITIPLLSLGAFTLVTGLIFSYRRRPLD